MGRLDGRVALVTGGGRGFGRAIALAFGREGADVVVNYHENATAAAEVAREIEKLGRRAVAVRGDVAQEEDVRAMVDGALGRLGRLDVLVNNAGVMERGRFAEDPVSRYQRMFDINVTGTLLCTRHALPAMIGRRYGRIINLSSQLARAGVGADGITVNAIAPGGIDTDMSRDVMTPEYRARRTKELPVRHLGEVGDVAYCALFLADEAAGYLTGQVLHPSGGWVMP